MKCDQRHRPEINIESGTATSIDYNSGLANVYLNKNGALCKEVAFAMEDEIVNMRELKCKNKTLYFFQEAIRAHTQRVAPVCEHFMFCGGCLYQHMSREYYAKHKLSILNNIFKNCFYVSEIDYIIEAGKRRKTNIECIKKNDKLYLGFHRYGSHQIININNCTILRPEINLILEPLKALLVDLLDNGQKSEIFIILADNGIDIGLQINDIEKFNDTRSRLITSFCSEHAQIIRFKLKNIQYYGSASESPYVTFAGYKLAINSYAFMQTSKEAEIAIIEIIKEYVASFEKLSIADLFCGRGLYALNLYDQCLKIDAFEIAEDAIVDLQEAICTYNLSRLNVYNRNLFDNPLDLEDLSQYDLIIINPPRPGASEQCKNITGGCICKYIIYVSCNPSSFVSDAEILMNNGYELIKLKLVDQFIWTNHCELVAFFIAQ